MAKQILIDTIRVRGIGAAQLNVDTALVSSSPDALFVSRVARYDTTAGDIVATLPFASTVKNGDRLYAKNEVGGNAVNVTPDGTDTVDGVVAISAVTAGLAAQFASDGISNWTRL